MLKAILLCSLLAAPAAAYTPVGYPGSIWGNASRDAANFEGTGSQGRVTQGVSWLSLPLKGHFRTQGGYRWRFRSGNNLYYDAHAPVVGAAFSFPYVDLGADFAWVRFPELERNEENFELYASWYRKWDLAKYVLKERRLLGVPIVGLPFSSWGRGSYDLNDVEGTGTMGWVTMGVDWLEFGPKGSEVLARTFGRYSWRFRDKNRPYYNMQGPSVGAELEWKFLKLGAQRYWHKFPELERETSDFEFYLSWYYRWDLKNLAKSK